MVRQDPLSLGGGAAVIHIYYNRLTDEAGGQASYELEFPNGGMVYVVGNIVEQRV